MKNALKWRPIKTAPKDERILIYLPGGAIEFGELWTKGLAPLWCYSDTGNATLKTPTHWMPVPEPLTESQP